MLMSMLASNKPDMSGGITLGPATKRSTKGTKLLYWPESVGASC